MTEFLDLRAPSSFVHGLFLRFGEAYESLISCSMFELVDKCVERPRGGRQANISSHAPISPYLRRYFAFERCHVKNKRAPLTSLARYSLISNSRSERC